MVILMAILKIFGILILAPLCGGLLTGIDRKITARMQRRQGPPLLQPFYDVIKLLQKEATTVNHVTRFYITLALFFSVFTVVLFWLGMDILLCIFAFTLASMFFVVAGYSSFSPFSFAGTERELLQIMCYEPMVLIAAFGYYKVIGSFSVAAAFSADRPAFVKLPLIFLGFVYVLTVKLRKSPFDLSMSHHGHQELVKGITTELTGICLAMVEIMHWHEIVFALSFTYIFVVWAAPASRAYALLACLLIFFFEILIDNVFARVKWQAALKYSWLISAAAGTVNLLVLNFI